MVPVLRVAVLVPILLLAAGGQRMRGQCLQNHYVSDGLPPSQLDCQPMATLTDIAPEQMTADAQALLQSRHVDLVRAARFHGFDIDDAGWTYTQSVSPIIQKHLILAFVRQGQAHDRSRFIAVLPQDTKQLVQVVPAYTHGLHPFRADWQDKSTYSIFNRLLRSERAPGPISSDSAWVNYAALYIAIAGGIPAIPTESDSVVAGWKLAVRRATTPVILVSKNESATIAFSEISDPTRSASWKLNFDKHGQITRASRSEHRPQTPRLQTTLSNGDAEQLPAPSSLNR